MTFSITSTFPLATQKTRVYTRFSDGADDMVEVRILQGIHYRFSDELARKQGNAVAKQAFRGFLRPLHGRDDDDDDDDDGGRER